MKCIHDLQKLCHIKMHFNHHIKKLLAKHLQSHNKAREQNVRIIFQVKSQHHRVKLMNLNQFLTNYCDRFLHPRFRPLAHRNKMVAAWGVPHPGYT